MQENFATAFSLVKQQFVQVINTLDSIKLFGNFSIFEFFIALLVLGAILPIVIITIANWSSNSFSASLRADSRQQTAQYRQETVQYRHEVRDYHRSKQNKG